MPKLASPMGYALGLAGAVGVLYITPPKMRLAVGVLIVVSGALLLRGGVDGLKRDLGGA